MQLEGEDCMWFCYGALRGMLKCLIINNKKQLILKNNKTTSKIHHKDLGLVEYEFVDN